jgi:hypothetical protein
LNYFTDDVIKTLSLGERLAYRRPRLDRQYLNGPEFLGTGHKFQRQGLPLGGLLAQCELATTTSRCPLSGKSGHRN